MRSLFTLSLVPLVQPIEFWQYSVDLHRGAKLLVCRVLLFITLVIRRLYKCSTTIFIGKTLHWYEANCVCVCACVSFKRYIHLDPNSAFGENADNKHKTRNKSRTETEFGVCVTINSHSVITARWCGDDNDNGRFHGYRAQRTGIMNINRFLILRRRNGSQWRNEILDFW